MEQAIWWPSLSTANSMTLSRGGQAMCLSSMTKRKNGCLAERNSFASMYLGTPAIWFEMTARRNFLVREQEPKHLWCSNSSLWSSASELNREVSFCFRWTKEKFLSNVEFLSPRVVIFVFFLIGFSFIVTTCKMSETACESWLVWADYEFICVGLYC